MLRAWRRLTQLVVPALLAAGLVTCGGDELTRPEQGDAAGLPSLAAGAPATVRIATQPPGSALDQEVWDPTRQPAVVVRDAAGTAVPGAVFLQKPFSVEELLEGLRSALARGAS